jgi:hypothetical protein
MKIVSSPAIVPTISGIAAASISTATADASPGNSARDYQTVARLV